MRRAKPDPQPQHINPHLLPPQLRELVRVMGEAAAFRLVEHLGGTALSIPKRVNAEHQLAELLGPIAFSQLIEARGGEVLQLPKYDSVLRQVRHQRVHELLRHHTIRQVALLTNYTMRQVINIKQSLGPEVIAQGDLFGEIEFEEQAARRAQRETRPQPAGAAHDPFGLAKA